MITMRPGPASSGRPDRVSAKMDKSQSRKPYRCNEIACKARYQGNGGLQRHIKEKHGAERLRCPFNDDRNACHSQVGRHFRTLSGFERKYRLVNHLCKARHGRSWLGATNTTFFRMPHPVSREAAILMVEDFNAQPELPGLRPSFSAHANEPRSDKVAETRKWHGTLWKYRCYFPPELLCPVEGCEHGVVGKGCFDKRDLFDHLAKGRYVHEQTHEMSSEEAEKLATATAETAERKYKGEFED
jgi:hypothetical protein